MKRAENEKSFIKDMLPLAQARGAAKQHIINKVILIPYRKTFRERATIGVIFQRHNRNSNFTLSKVCHVTK